MHQGSLTVDCVGEGSTVEKGPDKKEDGDTHQQKVLLFLGLVLAAACPKLGGVGLGKGGGGGTQC